MHSRPKKILLRSNLIESGLPEKATYASSRIDVFKVDDDKGHIIFTFKNDNHLFIYSYLLRKITNKLEVITQAIYSKSCEV